MFFQLSLFIIVICVNNSRVCYFLEKKSMIVFMIFIMVIIIISIMIIIMKIFIVIIKAHSGKVFTLKSSDRVIDPMQ